jgi:hypothetical protein
MIHVYTAKWQPFTCFKNWDGSIVLHGDRMLFRCHECRDRRWAKNLKVQAFYDMWRIRCADGCYGERE